MIVTPPKRYAPTSTRAGRQVANVVSANAIQPRPATMPSTHIGVYTTERYPPARPQHAPPKHTAAKRMPRTGKPSACADSGDSPTERITRPARVRYRNQAIAIASAMPRYTAQWWRKTAVPSKGTSASPGTPVGAVRGRFRLT